MRNFITFINISFPMRKNVSTTFAVAMNVLQHARTRWNNSSCIEIPREETVSGTFIIIVSEDDLKL